MIYTVVRDREKIRNYIKEPKDTELKDRMSKKLEQILEKEDTAHQNSFLTEEDILNLAELMQEDLEYIRRGYNGNDYDFEYMYAGKFKRIDLEHILRKAIENNTEIDKSIFNGTSALYILKDIH